MEPMVCKVRTYSNLPAHPNHALDALTHPHTHVHTSMQCLLQAPTQTASSKRAIWYPLAPLQALVSMPWLVPTWATWPQPTTLAPRLPPAGPTPRLLGVCAHCVHTHAESCLHGLPPCCVADTMWGKWRHRFWTPGTGALKNPRGPITPKQFANGMFLLLWYFNSETGYDDAGSLVPGAGPPSSRMPYWLSSGTLCSDTHNRTIPHQPLLLLSQV